MDACKPRMLKMHLEFDDYPPSIEQRHIVHNNSNNGLRRSVEQLEEQIKAFKVALLQALDDVNRIDTTPVAENIRNATQESNSNKQVNKFKNKHKNKNNLSSKHNDAENVAKARKGHHTNTVSRKKQQQVIDLRGNCVYIENIQCSDSSLEKAFGNIRKLANEMNANIPDDSVIHIDVKTKPTDCLDYYVHFRNGAIKKEFLKNRHSFVYRPETSPLRIFDYSEWGVVDIKNVHSTDLSLEAAYVNVMEIAEKMGITDDWNIRSSIDHIDVFSTKPNYLNYSVRFSNKFHKNEFVRRKQNLKQFPETKSVEILDAGGHRLNLCAMKNVNMSVASANVTGMAKLIGLPLATDNLKRIYVLNYIPNYVDTSGLSFVVEFSSKQVKDEFLSKEDKLEELEYFYSDIQISDIKEDKNNALIKYETGHLVTAFSFIGLAKQLGVSLTRDEIQNIFDLSEFTHEV